MNITSKQWFQIISGAISGLITGAALLQQLVGQTVALQIVAGLGIANIILSSVGTALSGQAGLVKDVAAMPGVDKITVNANATQSLASVAVASDQPKVAASQGSLQEVATIAKGNA